MARSSRHKSSKHSSRDAREYSDSEKDSSLKEKKVREEMSSKVSKDSGSSEKRKHVVDAKDSIGSGNGEFAEEHGVSKRRKDRVADEDVGDRWNGGEDDRGEKNDGERAVKSKASGDSKSKSSRRHDVIGERREGSEETRKSSKSKSDRDSGRRDGKEVGVDRERKGREAKIEKSGDSVVAADAADRELSRKNGAQVHAAEDERKAKKVEENTEFNFWDESRKPDPESEFERRSRRRRDGSVDGDRHGEDISVINDRELSSRDDISKEGKCKTQRHKDERYRDKYREDLVKDNRSRDEKLRDEQPARDHIHRSDDKHYRDERDSAEVRPKKSKPQERDRDRDRDRDHDRDHGRDRHHDRELDRDRDRDSNHDRVRDRDRDHCRDRDADRYRDQDRDCVHERDCDDRSAGYKDSRGKKRSPDDRDDPNDLKSRSSKLHHSDMGKRSLSSGRVESDADRGRSHSNQVYVDNPISNNRHFYEAHFGNDEYRHFKQENLKFGDRLTGQRTCASSTRELTTVSGTLDRVSNFRSLENLIKMDDNPLGELSFERSSSSKASPLGLVERSPSSTSIDRRNSNRTGVRRSLDIDDTGRKSSGSNDAREGSANEDRLSRDIHSEKAFVDESSQADSFYHNRNNQNSSSSLIPLQSGFRTGADSPSFRGSLDEDPRVNSSNRYRRSVDPNMGRGPGNAWRGVSNWSSQVPNGFIPFQHGPPHGGFQAMMPQFSSPLFGVRPSLEINHSGIPYHMHDNDRFSGHLRPLGWQNMVDASGPSHLHGWDGSNGVFRSESHMYGGTDWDQSRHSMNGRGWETSADMWKGQNGDANMDYLLASQKVDCPVRASTDEVLAGSMDQRSQSVSNYHGVRAKSIEMKRSSGTSLAKETSVSPPSSAHEKIPEPPKILSGNDTDICLIYLSKVDISTELVHPELYDQCTSLLSMEQNGTVEEDVTKHMNLKEGWSAGSKIHGAMSSVSLFPTVKDSIFKRAMDLYKKQSIETRGASISNGNKSDLVSASNQGKMEEDVPVSDEVKLEEQIPTSDLELVEPISAIAQVETEELPAVVQEIPGNLVCTSSYKVQEHTHTAKSEPVEAPSRDSIEELQIFSREKVDKMSFESHKAENKDCLLPLENSLQTATISPANGDDINGVGEKKGNHSACNVEEQQAIGDTMRGPLVFTDGSSGVCEALMPGSNESESVILSRIHHSPENTH